MTIAMVVVGVILLGLHWKGPNAVWGGATGGAVVGLMVALARGDWGLMAVSFGIGTLCGALFEWLGRLSNHIKQRRG